MVQELNVLVAGAAGRIGESVVKALLQYKNIKVTALASSLNPSDEGKKKKLAYFKDLGVALVEAQLDNQESLLKATKGIDVVISALNGDQKILGDGQGALADASVANNVKLFIPSHFGTYDENITLEDNALVFGKKQVAGFIESKGLKIKTFSTGPFYEFLDWLFFDEEKQEYHYFGDKNEALQTIGIEDIGKFVAAAVHDPSRWDSLPKKLNITGETGLTIAKFEQYLRDAGDKTPVVKAGSLEEARKKSQELFSQIKAPQDFLQAFIWVLRSFVPSAKVSPETYHNNLFPEVKPLSLKEYLQKRGGREQQSVKLH